MVFDGPADVDSLRDVDIPDHTAHDEHHLQLLATTLEIKDHHPAIQLRYLPKPKKQSLP